MFDVVSGREKQIDLFRIKGFITSMGQLEGREEDISDGAIENMVKFYSGGSLGYVLGDVGWLWRIGLELCCVGRIAY